MSATAYTKATTKTPPIHVLRGMLRLLRTPDFPTDILRKESSSHEAVVSSASSSSLTSRKHRLNETQQMLMNQYRQTQKENLSQEHQQHLRLMAVHYYNLKHDLMERNRLYKLDTGVEKQLGGYEMSRRAAARAGLQMPKLMNDNPDLK